MEAATVSAFTECLVNIILVIWACLSTTFLVTQIFDTISNHKREKRNEAWEAEKQKLEKEHTQRDLEYHEARMKELERK